MPSRLGEGQRRRETDVAAFEQRAPFRARPAHEEFAEASLQRRPFAHVVLRLRIDVGKAELFEEQRIELRFERADRHVAAVGAEIGVVEGKSWKMLGLGASTMPLAARPERDAAESSRDVDDRGVDDGALARPARGEDAAHDSEGEPERAARVAEHRQRDDWRLAGTLAEAARR